MPGLYLPAGQPPPAPMRPKLQALHDFAELFADRFGTTRCPQVAAGLAFTTLLAVVPLVTVTVIAFSRLPGVEALGAALERFLLDNLLPERAGQIIASHALQFSEQAGRLTTIGLAIVAITALLLLSTIEKVFNQIWGVRQPRPMLQRITVSWFVLTLGPIAFGASAFATGYLVATSASISGNLPWVGELTARLLPPLLLGALFSFLYFAVPNHPVRPAHAIAGGLAAAVAFVLMQRAFGMFIARVPSYTLIYGAFAVLPIFLIWLYLSWMVILVGALISATLPAFLERQRLTPPFAGDRAWAAVTMLATLGASQLRGTPVSFGTLCESVGWREHATEALLDDLHRSGWATRTEDGDWVLTRTPAELRISTVIERFALDPSRWLAATAQGPSAAVASELDHHLGGLSLTLQDLIASAQGGSSATTRTAGTDAAARPKS
ncbi:YihY family inner membrane protein [Thauera phenolivorans]|nr:YihY family inner membrane protein [Thauera phenolivorans]